MEKRQSTSFIRSLVLSVVLFVLACIPRLYRIDNPVADWHSWRQADTAAVSRNFIKEGFTPFLPKADSFFALNSIEYNPKRYFLAEFPLYNILTYPLYKQFGVHEELARLVSVISSSLTAVVLCWLVAKLSNTKVGFLAGLIFAILPYSIYYGRVIMPDPLHIFLSVLAIYLVLLWTEKNSWIFALFAGCAYAGALLTKPYALVLLLPITLLVFWGYRLKAFFQPKVYLFFLLSLVPLYFWRKHIQQYPEGMFGTEWLFNQGNIRFTGAFFHWILFEHIERVIFASGGFVLFFLGLTTTKLHTKCGVLLFSWLIAVLAFFTIIAKGNVTHDYYQMPILPVGAYYIGQGIYWLLSKKEGLLQKCLSLGITGVLVTMMIAFGWYEVRGYFNVNRWEIVHAGQAADELLPQDAKVVAPYYRDPAFLYQTKRYGWTTSEGKIGSFMQQGATYLVAVDFDTEVTDYMKRCVIVKQDPRWVIVDLRSCKPETPKAL